MSRSGNFVLAIIGLGVGWATAAIPEPDAVLFGPALVSGVQVQQRSAVVLVTRLPSGREIGRFDFGDCNADGVRDVCELSCTAPGCSGVAGCGTARDTSPADGLLDDCADSLYVLKTRIESTPDGISPSGNAAVLNVANPTSVNVFMSVAGGAEKFVRSLRIDERGKIRNLVMSILDRFAFREFQKCLDGPGNSSHAAACPSESSTAADYDEDRDVDLRDFAFIQNHFVAN